MSSAVADVAADAVALDAVTLGTGAALVEATEDVDDGERQVHKTAGSIKTIQARNEPMMSRAPYPVVLLLACSQASTPTPPPQPMFVAPAPTPPTWTGPPAGPPPVAAPTPAPAPLPPWAKLDAEHGCFAWSATEHTAACVIDVSSIAKGCTMNLTFIGPQKAERFSIMKVPPQCLGEQRPNLSAADRDRATKRLETSYSRLERAGTSLDPEGRAEVAGVSFEYRRKKTGSVGIPKAGSWDVFQDTLRMTCKGRVQDLVKERIENPATASASVHQTEPGWLLVTFGFTYGIEGDSGGTFTAVVIDTSRCVVHKP